MKIRKPKKIVYKRLPIAFLMRQFGQDLYERYCDSDYTVMKCFIDGRFDSYTVCDGLLDTVFASPDFHEVKEYLDYRCQPWG